MLAGFLQQRKKRLNKKPAVTDVEKDIHQVFAIIKMLNAIFAKN